MMSRWVQSSVRAVVLAAALWPVSPLGAACEAAAAEGSLRRIGAHVEIDDPAMPGLIAGGAEVSVKGHSEGRMLVFGADVDLNVQDDEALYLAAADVRTAGSVKGDATVVAGRITASGMFEDNLSIVASRIILAKGSKTVGVAELRGAKVELAGDSLGQVQIDASEVDISGTIKGPLRIEAPHIHFADGAVIEGDAELYTIAEPVVDAGAKLTGHINRHSLSDISAARALAASGPLARLISAVFLLGSALMAGLLFLWLGRGGAEGAIDELIDSPAASGLWGLGAIVLMPIAFVVLCLTIVGAPVGALALLALPLLMLVGYACAGLGIGEWFFNRLGEPRSAGIRALHLLIGLVVLGALGLLPWAGPVVLTVATLCGLGALLRTVDDRMRGPGAA